MLDENIIPSVILWWIVAVDIPLIGGFIVTMVRLRKDMTETYMRLTESLSNFKLEVAHAYASIHQLKDVEGRLIAHLSRIETKLDHTSLKAAHAFYAHSQHAKEEEGL